MEELCAAAIRALSDEPRVHFRGGWLHRDDLLLPMFAPHLHPGEGSDFGSSRGAADGMALRLIHSDEVVHRRLRPEGAVERLVFEMLEQFRVESLADPGLRGVVANLEDRHLSWSREVLSSGLAETTRGQTIFTLAQICRSRVMREPVAEEVEDLIESTRASLVPLLRSHLSALHRTRTTQERYAEHALAIAATVGSLLRRHHEEPDGAGRALLPLFLDPGGDPAEYAGAGPAEATQPSAAGRGAYRVFTRAYDQEDAAVSRVRPALLAKYREDLDRRIADDRIPVHHLARRLRSLYEEGIDGWDGGQESGIIDGRRLTQLISSPTEHRLFQLPRTEPVADFLIGVLIDCSGSMKQHIESVAVLVDVLARAVDIIGGRSEVFGFTTGAWNGGRALRDWSRSGRPTQPGRLNERLHLVFKDADTSWRRSRAGIAALLKQDLFREGLDGEAVDWACRRLEQQQARRSILLVISDGAPMDSATGLHNDAEYLDRHLVETVRLHERRRRVQIVGLGVGLDLSRYYRRSHAMDLSQGVGILVLNEIVDTIAGQGAGRR